MRLNRKKIARVAAYSTLTPRSPLGVDNDVLHAARRLGEGQSVLLKPFQAQLDRSRIRRPTSSSESPVATQPDRSGT